MSHQGVWQRTIETLKEHYYCIAVDLPGFGESDKPADGDYSIPAQAKRISKITETLKLDYFVLVGHSMGGQIGLYLASTLVPQRLTRLVSVSGVVTGILSRRARGLNRLLVDVGVKIPWVYNVIRLLCNCPRFSYWAFAVWFRDPASLPFTSWEMDRKMALRPDTAIPVYQAWKSLEGLDLTASLPDIAIPVLAIHGRQDGTVPVSDAQLVKEHVPGARLVQIEQCGHFPMYEKFEDYSGALQEFLK
jgi:pimeloyl-ACP methyl ester carboxylesterase